MTMKTKVALISFAVLMLMTGCSTWDGMNHRERSATTGAALGGVAGAVVTDGGILGTVGGAALGGLLGDQFGKSSNNNRRDYDKRRYNDRKHYDNRGHRGNRGNRGYRGNNGKRYR